VITNNRLKKRTLLFGSKLQPNIGNTSRRLSTVFTRSAITLPEVHRFGWNLGLSEHIFWGWPW